jgi:hypothetical protein
MCISVKNKQKSCLLEIILIKKWTPPVMFYFEKCERKVCATYGIWTLVMGLMWRDKTLAIFSMLPWCSNKWSYATWVHTLLRRVGFWPQGGFKMKTCQHESFLPRRDEQLSFFNHLNLISHACLNLKNICVHNIDTFACAHVMGLGDRWKSHTRIIKSLRVLFFEWVDLLGCFVDIQVKLWGFQWPIIPFVHVT